MWYSRWAMAEERADTERRATGPGSGSGGARPGSGRKPGSTIANGRVRPLKASREKAELLSLWRAEVGKQFETLVQAQIESAQGVTHMVARDAAGRWTTVTDPAVMVDRLNAGEKSYRLSAVAPNATLIGQIMDRMFGQAKQTIDLDVSTEPSRLSDRELSESLQRLMQKLSPAALPAVDVVPVASETYERNELSPHTSTADDERNELSPQIDTQTDERNEISPVEASVTEEDLPLVEIAFGPPETHEANTMEPLRDDEEWPDV